VTFHESVFAGEESEAAPLRYGVLKQQIDFRLNVPFNRGRSQRPEFRSEGGGGGLLG